jgi:hypothetical protein
MNSQKISLDRLVGIAGVTVLAGFALLTFQAGPYRYSSICRTCGAISRTTQWQIPRAVALGAEISIFSRSSVSQTPVSLSLSTNGIIGHHTHQWVFATGSGNGVRCALGSAHNVRSTVESAEVGQLIAVLEHCGERELRDRVLTNVFDDTTTIAVRRLRPPKGEFANAKEAHEWLTEQSKVLDEMVAIYTEKLSQGHTALQAR